jgi:16S rRNA (guanine527-N7)-methyltransferase
LDLGSGGGVPGLVLAHRWADSRWILLDSSERRTAFLEESVARLGWAERVTVVRARAEEAGRDPQLRASVDLVVARSFAAPGPTAECAAPFLRVGGHLLVSEPPDADPAERWPERVTELGLRFQGVAPGPPHVAVLEQVDLCPESYPRASGRPTKRPLF